MHWLSIEDWFTIFCGIFIETIIIGGLLNYMSNRQQQQSEEHLEKQLEKMDLTFQRNFNELNLSLYNSKEEVKDHLRDASREVKS